MCIDPNPWINNYCKGSCGVDPDAHCIEGLVCCFVNCTRYCDNGFTPDSPCPVFKKCVKPADCAPGSIQTYEPNKINKSCFFTESPGP